MMSKLENPGVSVSIEAARRPTAPGVLDLMTLALGNAPGAYRFLLTSRGCTEDALIGDSPPA